MAEPLCARLSTFAYNSTTTSLDGYYQRLYTYGMYVIYMRETWMTCLTCITCIDIDVGFIGNKKGSVEGFEGIWKSLI